MTLSGMRKQDVAARLRKDFVSTERQEKCFRLDFLVYIFGKCKKTKFLECENVGGDVI